MVEKQASSEIAQSRERFDPFHELIVRHDRGVFGVPTSWKAMCGMLEQAERDTRERVAQLVETAKIHAHQEGNDQDEAIAERMNKFLLRLTERIRGKE